MRWKVLMCVLFWSTASCWATNISWVGTFTDDNQIFQAWFTLPTGGDVTIQSWGYGGTGAGTNAGGQTISQGGFPTVLALFDDAAPQNLLALDAYGGTPPGGCGTRNIDTNTSQCLDAYLQVTLASGTYFFTLTAQDNEPYGPTFADGFTGYGSFTDFLGNERSQDFAVDLVGPADMPNPTPEPGTALPLAAVLLAGLWRARRRSRDGVRCA